MDYYCKSHDAIWNTSRLWSHNRRGGAETIMSDSERGKTIPHEARGQFDQQNHRGPLGPRWFWIKLPESRVRYRLPEFTIDHRRKWDKEQRAIYDLYFDCALLNHFPDSMNQHII